MPSVTRTGADLELPNNKGFRGLGVYGLGFRVGITCLPHEIRCHLPCLNIMRLDRHGSKTSPILVSESLETAIATYLWDMYCKHNGFQYNHSVDIHCQLGVSDTLDLRPHPEHTEAERTSGRGMPASMSGH